MYSTTGVGKLSESQKSKLRNGHPVRIKIGSGNSLNLTAEQIKKLTQAHKKGAAYTITFHPEQAEKHGSGFFGDIATKAKAFAKKHKDLINPIIGRVRAGVHGGIDKLSNKAKEKLEELASKANTKVDEFIQPIEGEGVKRRRGRPKKGTGIIGDVLKGLISTTGLGVVKPKRLQKEGKGIIGDVLKGLISTTGLGVVKPKRIRQGKGIMSSLLKAVAPAIIDAAAGAVKGKVSTIGSGSKHKARRPKGRGGGALFPAGNYGPGD
jgi:hypothetical protein